MNICLLTDEQKSYVFEGDREYTNNDLLDLSIVATANEALVKTMRSYCLDSNTTLNREHLVNLLNILDWLSEPLAAYFLETALWGDLPEATQETKKEDEA